MAAPASRESPRLLYITHEPPLPAESGARVRYANLIEQLTARGWAVTLFSLDWGDPPAADREGLAAICEEVLLVPFERGSIGRKLGLAANILRSRAFQHDYFYSPALARRLRGLLDARHFDVIVAGQLYCYPYVPPEARGRAVLDCHNVEVARMESMAAALWPRPAGVVARLQRSPVERYEREAVRSVKHTLAVSVPEQRHFERIAPGRVSVVPNGVDCRRLPARAEVPEDPRLLFVGSMDYNPNLDAAMYLVEEILPRVRSRVDLTLLGRNPSGKLVDAAARAGSSVEVTGAVPSTEPYFERSRLMVVPLRFGGGTRLKILESLARGVPVISTTIGAEGLDLVHGHDLILADDPQDMAGRIDELLGNTELCRSLAANGRATVEQRYDWERVAGGLHETLSGLVRAQG